MQNHPVKVKASSHAVCNVAGGLLCREGLQTQFVCKLCCKCAVEALLQKGAAETDPTVCSTKPSL